MSARTGVQMKAAGRYAGGERGGFLTDEAGRALVLKRNPAGIAPATTAALAEVGYPAPRYVFAHLCVRQTGWSLRYHGTESGERCCATRRRRAFSALTDAHTFPAMAAGSAYLRAAALGGALAPILFAVVVVSLTLAEYEFATQLGWHPVRRTRAGWPSILALGDVGWLLTATLTCCGALGVAFAAALARAVKRTVWSTVGIALLAVLAAAVGLESFTTDPPGSLAPPTWHGEIHDGAYPVLVVSAIGAPLFLAVGFARDPRWRSCAPYSLATAVVLLGTLLLQLERAYAQLLEYAFFATLLVWLELLAVRLVRLTVR